MTRAENLLFRTRISPRHDGRCGRPGRRVRPPLGGHHHADVQGVGGRRKVERDTPPTPVGAQQFLCTPLSCARARNWQLAELDKPCGDGQVIAQAWGVGEAGVAAPPPPTPPFLKHAPHWGDDQTRPLPTLRPSHPLASTARSPPSSSTSSAACSPSPLSPTLWSSSSC